MSIGRYNGVNYRRQRICDVLLVDAKTRWWFVYDDHWRTDGSHFTTLHELKKAVDAGYVVEVGSCLGVVPLLRREVGSCSRALPEVFRVT